VKKKKNKIFDEQRRGKVLLQTNRVVGKTKLKFNGKKRRRKKRPVGASEEKNRDNY